MAEIFSQILKFLTKQLSFVATSFNSVVEYITSYFSDTKQIESPVLENNNNSDNKIEDENKEQIGEYVTDPNMSMYNLWIKPIQNGTFSLAFGLLRNYNNLWTEDELKTKLQNAITTKTLLVKRQEIEIINEINKILLDNKICIIELDSYGNVVRLDTEIHLYNSDVEEGLIEN